MSSQTKLYRQCIDGHVFKLGKSTAKYLEKHPKEIKCTICNKEGCAVISKNEYEKIKNLRYSFMKE